MWENFDNQMKMRPKQFVGGLVKCDPQSPLLPLTPNPNSHRQWEKEGLEMNCNRESMCFEEGSPIIFRMS